MGVTMFVTTTDVSFGKSEFVKARLITVDQAKDVFGVPLLLVGVDQATEVAGVPLEGTGGSVDGVQLRKVLTADTKHTDFTAIWEWVSDDPQSPRMLEDIHFGVVVAARAGMALASAYVYASLAPISRATVAEVKAPIPRFTNYSEAIPLFSIER